MRAAWAVVGLFVVAVLVVVAIGLKKEGQGDWVGWVVSADSVLRPKRSYVPKKVSNPTLQIIRSIELNGADSLALVRVYGIGPVFAGRILAYRRALGGFYRVEQLREVRGISEEVFLRIEKNFWVDVAQIEKININFAAPTVLVAHPYVTPNMASRLVEGKMKGGYYNKVEDLLDRDILLPQEARRLAPYFLFTQVE